MTHEHCTRVGDLVRAELNVFQTHMAKHKWFRHITDDAEALKSINDEYGPFVRDMFCRFACPDRKDCELMLRGVPSGTPERTIVEQWDSCKEELKEAQECIELLVKIVPVSELCIPASAEHPHGRSLRAQDYIKAVKLGKLRKKFYNQEAAMALAEERMNNLALEIRELEQEIARESSSDNGELREDP